MIEDFKYPRFMAYCGLILRNLILIGKSLEYSLTLCITEKEPKKSSTKYLCSQISGKLYNRFDFICYLCSKLIDLLEMSRMVNFKGF